MTPYQRGNRDGLLNAAAEMRKMAEMYLAEYTKFAESPNFERNPILVRLADKNYFGYTTYSMAAVRLAALSEAMPEDPQEAT